MQKLTYTAINKTLAALLVVNISQPFTFVTWPQQSVRNDITPGVSHDTI